MKKIIVLIFLVLALTSCKNETIIIIKNEENFKIIQFNLKAEKSPSS